MKNKRSLFAVPYIVWMAFLVVIPIIIMVVYAFTTGATDGSLGAFTLDNFTSMGSYTVVFTRSFKLALIATAVVLFTFILIINVSFSLLKRRKQV
mgnify:CR=1 FL=1